MRDLHEHTFQQKGQRSAAAQWQFYFIFFLAEGHLKKEWTYNETVSCNDWIKHQGEAYYAFPQGEGEEEDEY